MYPRAFSHLSYIVLLIVVIYSYFQAFSLKKSRRFVLLTYKMKCYILKKQGSCQKIFFETPYNFYNFKRYLQQMFIQKFERFTKLGGNLEFVWKTKSKFSSASPYPRYRVVICPHLMEGKGSICMYVFVLNGLSIQLLLTFSLSNSFEKSNQKVLQQEHGSLTSLPLRKL